MTVAVLYMPLLRFFDTNGDPVPGAKVYSYQANSTTPQAIFVDSLGVTPFTNPAVADSAGQLLAYMTVGQAYKINATDANDVQLPGWPIDNLSFLTIETGVLTPVAVGLTTAGSAAYTVQTGFYHRIGNLVFFTMQTNFTGHTGSGQFAMTGLPYPAASVPTAIQWSCHMVWGATGLFMAGPVSGSVQPGESMVRGYFVATTDDSIHNLDISPTAAVLVTGFYGV